MAKSFIPASEATFLQRFKRRYSAAEVDAYQKGEANDYGQTFKMVQREFNDALDSDIVPEGFNGDVDAWNQFRTEQKDRPASFFPDMTDVYKVLGKDKTNKFFAGSPLGRRLLENPEDPNSQIKNVDLEKTEESVDPETGETRYSPAVDTYNVSESGDVKRRTNEITDDGKPQRETEKFGFNNLSKDEFNAMVETFRLEKLKAAGIYSEGFVQAADLYKAASTDNYDLDTNLDEAMTGDRTKGVEVVKTIEQLRKNLKEKGFSITDPEQVKQSNEDANVTSAERMPDKTGIVSGAFVNPADPKVVKAKELATSYVRGDEVDVEALAQGLSPQFRKRWIENYKSNERNADRAKVTISRLESKQEKSGSLSKKDQTLLTQARTRLERSLDAQEDLIQRVSENVESDTRGYSRAVGGDLEQNRQKLEEKTFALTVEGLSATEGQRHLLNRVLH